MSNLSCNPLASTTGRTNFQRLSRLLIAGGSQVLRYLFDSIHPPTNLSVVLNDPVNVKILKGARLTKPQRSLLYPSTGAYPKSTDWDITLLFILLRNICGLAPPTTTGWDNLPCPTDVSVTADLARIKFYRNSLYAHVNEEMEVKDKEFRSLWQEISNALVRLAKHVNPTEEFAWKTRINTFKKCPLTPEDERNLEELTAWYDYDFDVKKGLKKLEVTSNELKNKVEEQLEIDRKKMQSQEIALVKI